MVAGGLKYSSDSVVIKPPNDRRLYRVIELHNGLVALLVHDPQIYPDGLSQDSHLLVKSEPEAEEDEDDEDEDGDEDDDEEDEDEDEEDEEEEEEEKQIEDKSSQTKKVFLLLCSFFTFS